MTSQARSSHDTRPVVCWETGEVYPSAASASREAGTGANNLFHAIETGGRAAGLHWYREGDRRPGPLDLKWGKGDQPPIVEFSTGRLFMRIDQAASAFGLSTCQVRYWTNKGVPDARGRIFARWHDGDFGICVDDISSPVIDRASGKVYPDVLHAAWDTGEGVLRILGHIQHGRFPLGGERWAWATLSQAMAAGLEAA